MANLAIGAWVRVSGGPGQSLVHLHEDCVSFLSERAVDCVNQFWPADGSLVPAIHWALPQLKSILGAELFDRIQEVQTDQHYSPPEKDLIPIYHGVSGELLKGVPMDKWHRVTKSKMRGWLAELSTGNHVQVTCLRYICGRWLPNTAGL